MGTRISRQQKQEWFELMFQAAVARKETLDLKKFLATFAVRHQSTIRTGKEILNLFVDLGRIEIKKIDGVEEIFILEKTNEN